MSNAEFYNFVIVGAGPAGLTAGIVAARNGFRAIILEKGEIAGPKPRGEGMAHTKIVDDILGEGYLPSIGLKSNGGRVWHSPGDKQTFTTYRTHDHYFFEWREFIDRQIPLLLYSLPCIRQFVPQSCQTLRPFGRDQYRQANSEANKGDDSNNLHCPDQRVIRVYVVSCFYPSLACLVGIS